MTNSFGRRLLDLTSKHGCKILQEALVLCHHIQQSEGWSWFYLPREPPKALGRFLRGRFSRGAACRGDVSHLRPECYDSTMTTFVHVRWTPSRRTKCSLLHDSAVPVLEILWYVVIAAAGTYSRDPELMRVRSYDQFVAYLRSGSMQAEGNAALIGVLFLTFARLRSSAKYR